MHIVISKNRCNCRKSDFAGVSTFFSHMSEMIVVESP